MNTMMYFGGGVLGWDRPDVHLPLTHQRVFKVSWNDVGVSILGEEPKDPLQSLYLLNGAVVGLLADHTRAFERVPGVVVDDEGVPLDCPRLLTKPVACPCVGLGVIRSIDTTHRVFYVATPVPLRLLETVTILARGSLDIPYQMLTRGQLDEGPYLSAVSASGLGSKVRKPRNNLLRKGTK